MSKCGADNIPLQAAASGIIKGCGVSKWAGSTIPFTIDDGRYREMSDGEIRISWIKRHSGPWPAIHYCAYLTLVDGHAEIVHAPGLCSAGGSPITLRLCRRPQAHRSLPCKI